MVNNLDRSICVITLGKCVHNWSLCQNFDWLLNTIDELNHEKLLVLIGLDILLGDDVLAAKKFKLILEYGFLFLLPKLLGKYCVNCFALLNRKPINR